MVIEIIDPVSICAQEYLLGQKIRTDLPYLTPGQDIIGYFSYYKNVDHVALRCTTPDDIRKLSKHYYQRPFSDLIWVKGIVDKNLSRPREITDLTNLG